MVLGEGRREGGVASRDTVPGVWIMYLSDLDAVPRSRLRLRSRAGPYDSAWSWAWIRRSSRASAVSAGRTESGAVVGPVSRTILGAGDVPRRTTAVCWPGEGSGGSLEVVVAPGVVTVCSDPRELKSAAGRAGCSVNSESKLESAGLLSAMASLFDQQASALLRLITCARGNGPGARPKGYCSSSVSL